MQTFNQILRVGIPLKLNMVVMDGRNIQDIIPMAELTRDYPVSVRYIEEMPFNGSGENRGLIWDHSNILGFLKDHYSNLEKLPVSYGSTAQRYKIDGYQGELGIIAAYSRTFCGTCNRIRVTPIGTLKTCLYDQGIFNIKDLMRHGATDPEIITALKTALNHRAKDGFEAEDRRSGSPIIESMSTIGG
jgi:molybdenum cofactor biosynthesis enzyme MoaA